MRSVARWSMGLAIVACGGGTGSDDGGGSTGSSGDAEGASSVDDGVTGSSSSSVDEGSTGASVTTMPADSSESTSSPSSSSSGSGGDPGTEIVHVDFERDVEGPYTEEMVEADFGIAPPWNDGLDDGRATIVADDGQFLRVTYPGGQYGPGDGGVQFIVALPATYDELRLSYRVRFGAGFDFVKGGKLPGLVGGSSPTGCVEDTDGFSARMMWRTDGAAVQYMYFPEKIEACGDDYAYAIAFTPGAWHTVEHRIVMNTPGEHEGVLQAWFDGELALDDTAFLYRLADGTYGVDALYFSTFFGGGDATWAPSADQTVDFDDFVITAP